MQSEGRVFRMIERAICTATVAALLAGCPKIGPVQGTDASTPEPDGGESDLGGDLAFARDLSMVVDGGRPPLTPAEIAAGLAAVSATITQNPLCQVLGPFHWKIGDATGTLGEGTIGALFTDATNMWIFSGTKWLFAAYVAERLDGQLSASIVEGLNFTSGWDGPSSHLCQVSDTVSSCFLNSLHSYDPLKKGKFFYGSGHMQKIAAEDLGLGPMNRVELAAELMATLGSYLSLTFPPSPLPAGGAATTPGHYAEFLRKMVAGDYKLKALLGTHAVCTNSVQCPNEATGQGLDASEVWDYSLGHWVERDPVQGDGSFSSPGAAGFYPWIDQSMRYWGLLARVDLVASQGDPAWESVRCGRKLRAAFFTGQVQP